MQLESADWPIFGWTADIRPSLQAAMASGRSVVLATLLRLEGSAPRPVGTQMLFDGAAATGYFSGGCLEADVANHAAAVLADGEPRYLVYGQGSPWIDVRLVCGGRMEILLERIDPDDRAAAILLSLAQQRRCAHWWSDGQRRYVSEVPVDQQSAVSGMPHYVLCHAPVWRVIVVGGDPIALAIAQLAATAGFESALVRPDGPAGPPPIGPINYHRGSIVGALEAIGIDRWTAVVTATHDDDLDEPALLQASRAGAGYVGVLGAIKRAADRNARLGKAGLSADQIASVHAPIGAPDCGKAPWEVAISVIAQIMQTRTRLARSG